MAQPETGRTRLSILIFYGLIIRQSPSDPHGRLYILGLMWCPGTSGLLTQLVFQGNLRGHGFGWGKTKYQFASYWIPLAYASVVSIFRSGSPAISIRTAGRLPGSPSESPRCLTW